MMWSRGEVNATMQGVSVVGTFSLYLNWIFRTQDKFPFQKKPEIVWSMDKRNTKELKKKNIWKILKFFLSGKLCLDLKSEERFWGQIRNNWRGEAWKKVYDHQLSSTYLNDFPLFSSLLPLIKTFC